MDRTEIDHNGRLKSTPGPFGIERGLARSRRLEVESSTIPPDQDERMSDLQEDSDRQLTDPETWVDLHGDFLFRFALARVGNREVAEDLVQQFANANFVVYDQDVGHRGQYSRPFDLMPWVGPAPSVMW